MSDVIQKGSALPNTIPVGDLAAASTPDPTPLGDETFGIPGELPPEAGPEQPESEEIFGEPPAAPAAPPAATPPEEATVLIDGQQVPWSKLPEETKKAVTDAYVNSQNWQTANTNRAKALADERKTFDSERQEQKTVMDEWNALNRAFNQYPQLSSLMKRFLDGDQAVAQFANQLYQGGSAAQPGVQPPGVQPPGQGSGSLPNQPSPMLIEMQNTLRTLQGQMTNLQKENSTLKQGRESDQIDRDTEAAFAALKADNPNFDRKEFAQYLENVVGTMNDKTALFKLIYDARTGRNKGEIAKKAQADMAKNIKDGKAAAVETGSGTPAVGLPKNVDLSKKSWDDIFDAFGKEQGVADDEAMTVF